MRVRPRLLVLGLPLVAVAVAGSAFAYVCHPAARGARTLTFAAPVRSVTLIGNRVDVVVGRRTCARVSWNTTSGAATRHAAACARRATQAAGTSAGRLAIDARGRQVLRIAGRDLPLPTFARSAIVDRGVALVHATRPDGGLFAVRVADGAFTFLGPEGRAFGPQLGRSGAVFHDAESKSSLRAGRTVVKFVPRRAIAHGFAATTAPLATGGAIHGLSMDGLRVALSVGDRAARCDRVLYWNVAWRPAQRISAPSGPTCLPGTPGTRIGSLAIGGFRTEWVTASAAGTRLIAGSPRCQEWVVRRLANGPGGERIAAVAADGATVAYAATSQEAGLRGSTSVGVVTGGWRARQVATGVGAPRSLAVSGTRIAVLWPSGVVELRTVQGARAGAVRVGAARAIALEGTMLATLRGSRLDVYDTRTGSRTRSVRLPAGAVGLDLQDGLAAFARGRLAYVVDLVSGRSVVVGHAARRLIGVQIERPGLVYAWSDARRGVARFVPAIQIDRALRIGR